MSEHAVHEPQGAVSRRRGNWVLFGSGWQANVHFGPFRIVSNILIALGFLLLASSWRVLYNAQRTRTLATTGPYARME